MADNKVSKGFVTPGFPNLSPAKFYHLIEVLGKELGEAAKEKVQDKIKKVGAVASGQFLRSVTAEVSRLGTSNAYVRVSSTDRAAEAIESGLKPTIVPLVAIEKWMADKGISADPVYAQRIKTKLAEEGYEARHVFEDTYEEINEMIDKMVAEILEREEFVEFK